MAKKKTENIKAAPVLRAPSGGDEPTPTPEQTRTRTYQIMDPWKDRDVVNLVDVKSVDGEITDVKINGEPAGGGGGGLVKVTIINNTSNELEVNVVHLSEADGTMPAHLDYYAYPAANSTLEIYAVTLREYSKIFAIGSYTMEVTGEVTKDTGTTMTLATIHGPGTVTFSQGSNIEV